MLYRKIVEFKSFDHDKVIRGKKTVLVGGCFDILHYGHLQFLSRAKDSGDFLVIVLESDDAIRRIKNRESFHTQKERAEILAALNIVDLIVLLPDMPHDQEYADVVDLIHPHIIAVTAGDPYLKQKKSFGDRIGAVIIEVCERYQKFSTSKMRTISL